MIEKSITLTELISNLVPRNILHSMLWDGVNYVLAVLSELEKTGFDISIINEDKFEFWIYEFHASKTNLWGEIIKDDDINVASVMNHQHVLAGFLNIKKGGKYILNYS